MTRPIYPFDPHGSDVACYIPNEAKSLPAGKLKVIFPLAAPFFLKDFQIKQGTKVLKEGVDFYFGHRYLKGSHLSAQRISGSIWITNKTLVGPFQLQYRTVGGMYTVSAEQIAAYLPKMVDPTNEYWDDVLGEDLFYPPVKPAYDRDRFVAEPELIQTLNQVRDAVASKDPTKKESHKLAAALIANLEKIVTDSQWAAHKADEQIPHEETHYDAGALHKDGIAKDASKAYGKTKTQLRDAVLAETDVSSVTAGLFPLNADRVVTGDVVLADGRAHIATQLGAGKVPVIDLSSGNAQMTAVNDTLVHADIDNVGGKKAKLQSGANVLTVDSSGPGTDNKSVKYNGQEVLTTETLAAYASSASGSAPTSLVYRDGPNIDFSGKGTPSDPLKASVPMPDAGAGSPGLATIEPAGRNVSGPYGASQKAINDQRKIILSLVPVTRKINGITLDADILLNKGHLGLDKVANLADLDLPVNNHASELLVDIKAQVGHVHESSEVTVSNATLTQKGGTQHSDAVDSTDITMSTTAVAVKRVLDAAKTLEDTAGKYVPEDLMQLSRYGKFGYLPVPVLGNYPASGVRSGALVAGELENDGTLVLLRNGMDEIETGLFYCYGQIDSQGRIVKLYPTTQRYRPADLPDNVAVEACWRGGNGVLLLKTNDGVYAVLTKGTMDSRQHHAVRLNGYAGGGRAYYPLITDDKFIIVYTAITNGIPFAVKIDYCPLADLVNGNNVTMQTMPLTATDVKGNVVGPSNVIQFAQATFAGNDPNANALAYNSDGYFTTVNLAHATNNYVVAFEGDKIRINHFCTTYMANNVRDQRQYWNTSALIDLTARTATLDKPSVFPMKISSAGIDHNSNTALGLLDGVANNESMMFESKGKWFTYVSYGVFFTPFMRACTLANGLSNLEGIHCDRIGWTNLGDPRAVIGAYGSVLRGRMNGWHELGGNRALVYTVNSESVLLEYDPNGSFNGAAGFGPTNNRKIIPYATASMYKRIPYIYDGVTERSEGFIFNDVSRDGSGKLVGETLSAPINVSDAAFSSLKSAAVTMAMSGLDPAYYIDSRLTLFVNPIAGMPMLGSLLVCRYNTAEKTTRVLESTVFTFTANARTGNITTLTIGSKVGNAVLSGNATSVSDISEHNAVGFSLAKLADGKWLYVMGGCGNGTWVGNGGYASHAFVYDHGIGAWQNSIFRQAYYHTPSGLVYNKKYGLMYVAPTSSNEGLYGDVYGNTQAAIVNAVANGLSPRVVLQMTRVAEGWNVYFTEEVPGILNGNQLRFPQTGYDLKALFPTGHQNATFYIYASVKSGSAVYEFSKTGYTDDLERVQIGYCKTDGSRITELRVDGLTRLGEFRELADHMASRHVHGIEGKTKEQLGYGLVENKEPRYELKDVGFAEVFNNWHRFSHGANNWAQPSNAAELNAWTYDPGTDRIKCTVNSATNIGFISDIAVGDFVFDVEVGVDATSPDADNDAITLVIAFKSINGKEQTITIVRAASIEPHVKTPTLLSVAYDYCLPDQKLIASVETNEVKGTPWKGRFSRIVITRTGDKFDIKATNIEARSWASATDADFVHKMSFTLNDMPELAMFKGENRFGYGAVSQTTATYKTYVRPDADDRNYYATHAAALKALAWHKDVVIANGIAVHGAVLPIPAGFSASEVMYFISPHRRVVGNAAHELSEITRVNLSINQTTRVVTATCTYTFASVSYTDNMEVNYYAVAIPGGKFFK